MPACILTLTLFGPGNAYFFETIWGRPAAKGGQLGGNGDPSLNTADYDFPIEIWAVTIPNLDD